MPIMQKQYLIRVQFEHAIYNNVNGNIAFTHFFCLFFMNFNENPDKGFKRSSLLSYKFYCINKKVLICEIMARRINN